MTLRLTSAKGSWTTFSWALGLWLAAACTDEKPSNSATTGGAGGSAGSGGIAPAVPIAGKAGTGTGGGGAAGGGALPDVCASTPPGQLALIDDFNDGDTVAAYEADREAYWFTIVDDTDGTLEPPGDFLPVAGGYLGTKAAHLSASGFTDWGAALTANLSHETQVRCPFNASAFAGLRFVARGEGRIRLQLAMPEVVEKEYGGLCDSATGQVCYDHHGLFITLEDEFKLYEVPWSKLTQRGFGDTVKFDPKTIMSLYFSMEREDLPVDMWIDQVELWDGTPGKLEPGGEGGAPAAEGGAPGAEGGAGGSSGESLGGASTGAGGDG